MTAFLAALQFLLMTPAFIRRAFTADEMGRSVAYYPFAGLLLGGLLALADAALGYIFPIAVRSALLLVIWIVLTGGLHLDGFLDSCDGLLGGFTPERRLEIMRDERVGAFGVAGGALLLLTMYGCLISLSADRWAALLLAPVLGRMAISLGIIAFPYARTSGLGRDIKDHAGARQAIVAALTTLAIVAVASLIRHTLAPVLALLIAAVVFWLSERFMLSRIPGMTGDTYGAINMLVEAAVLLAFVAAL